MSQRYSGAMAMRSSVTYTPCVAFLREQTGNIITSAQFKEWNMLSETRNNVKSGEESEDDSIVPPLLSKEEMDAMDSGNESNHDLISMEMLEDICDGSQSHMNVKQIEARYKIHDRISQRQSEWKGALKATRNMGKVLHKVFKTVVKEISQ